MAKTIEIEFLGKSVNLKVVGKKIVATLEDFPAVVTAKDDNGDDNGNKKVLQAWDKKGKVIISLS